MGDSRRWRRVGFTAENVGGLWMREVRGERLFGDWSVLTGKILSFQNRGLASLGKVAN